MVTSTTAPLATKTELKKVERNIRQEVLKVEDRLERVEDRLERVEEKVDIIEDKITGIGKKIDNLTNITVAFVGRIDDLETENAVGTNQMHELKTDVNDHGIRITKLETITHIS